MVVVVERPKPATPVVVVDTRSRAVPVAAVVDITAPPHMAASRAARALVVESEIAVTLAQVERLLGAVHRVEDLGVPNPDAVEFDTEG